MPDIFGTTRSSLTHEPAVAASGNAVPSFKPMTASAPVILIAGAILALATAWPSTGAAQAESENVKASDAHAQHKDKPSAGDRKHDMGAMGGVKKSEWWYDNYTRSRKPGMDGMEGMSGMKGMTKDGMNADSTAGKGFSSGRQMKSDDAGLMGMRTDDGTMTGMGAVGGTGSMNRSDINDLTRASSRPGLPGVSHIYHIGATGFFLDHAEHIALSAKQQEDLNVVRERALLSKATVQRRIDEAEQKLWELTGADDPDAAKIQATVQEIEKLRGEQRLGLIRSVAEAARRLTAEQRATLLGTKTPDADRKDSPDAK